MLTDTHTHTHTDKTITVPFRLRYAARVITYKIYIYVHNTLAKFACISHYKHVLCIQLD